MIQANLGDRAEREFLVSVNRDGRLIYYICVNINKIDNWVKIMLDRRNFVRIFVTTIWMCPSPWGSFWNNAMFFLQIYHLMVNLYGISFQIYQTLFDGIFAKENWNNLPYIYVWIIGIYWYFSHLLLTASNCAFNWNFNSVWWHRHI